MAERGCGGGIVSNMFTGNCAILFFILVFLILFVSPIHEFSAGV